MAKNEIYLNTKVAEAVAPLAKKKGVTKSAFVNELLTNVGVGKVDIKPVVLQIPKTLLTNNKESLQEWLENKSSGIVNLFYPQQ